MAEDREEEARRVGRLIAQLRERRGLTQEDLARAIDVGTSTVSRWERGLHQGMAPNVRKLARALEVTPAVLAPREPELESQLDRIERTLSELEEQLRLLRVDTAARDAEVLKRLDEGLPPIRRSPPPPPR